MINRETMRWVTIGLLCFFWLELFASTNSLEIIDKLYEVERQNKSLQQEIAALANVIETIMSEDPSSLYLARNRVADSLREELSKDSHLYHFPDLDEESYNRFIISLEGCKNTDDVRLHLWSYMVGIPIIGLAHTESYYDTCGHLLPKASKDERTELEISPGLKSLCVKISGQNEIGDKHKHYDVTDDMLHSVILYRKKFLYLSNEKREEECQKICWSLLENDLTDLDKLRDQDAQSVNGEQKLLTNLLRFLLRINHRGEKKPTFTLGLIKLFQNTAIYLSTCLGKKSVTINSPCSRGGVTYFGLQDGIFIARSKCSEDDIATLFGEQFFRRAFFEAHPCDCDGCAAALKCAYYPHYTFEMLPRNLYSLLKEQNKKGYEGEDDFAEEFALHMQGKATSLLVSHLIAYITLQQLQTRLCDKSELLIVLFEPTSKVDLSNLKSKKRETSDDESQDVLSKVEQFETALEHFRCKSYQGIRKIDLSNNDLGDRAIKKLAELLSKNVLPRLVELDISGNKITETGIAKFAKLLERDKFKRLIARSNRLNHLSEDISEKIKKKVIWEDSIELI